MQRSSQPQARLPQGMVLFAEDFDLDGQDPGGDAEPETIVPSYTAAELDEARRAGFAAGRRESAISDEPTTSFRASAAA